MLHVKAIKRTNLFAQKFSISFEFWNDMILINPSRMFICYLFNRQCTSSAKAWVLSVSLQSYSKIGKSQSFSCVTAIHRDSVICKRHSQIMAMIRMYNNLNLIANFQMKWKSDADILEQFAFWSECGTICTAHVFLRQNGWGDKKNGHTKTESSTKTHGEIYRNAIKIPVSFMLFMNWANHKSS